MIWVWLLIALAALATAIVIGRAVLISRRKSRNLVAAYEKHRLRPDERRELNQRLERPIVRPIPPRKARAREPSDDGADAGQSNE